MKVSINQLSEALGPTRRTWKKHLDAAGLEPDRKGGATLYELRDAIAAIPPELIGINPGESERLDPGQESARLNKAKADAQERENELRSGRIGDMDEIRETWFAEASRVRARLLQLPAALANRAHGLTRNEIEDIAREVVFDALQELAEYHEPEE